MEYFESSQHQEQNVEHDTSTFLEALESAKITEIDTEFDEGAVQALESALAETKVFLLGEIHGVMENPDIMYTLIKKFGFRNVALEWKPSLKEQVEQFLNGEGLDFESVKNSSDGRITAGHFALLKKLKEEGLLEKVTCFDQGGSPSWDVRDENMAQNIINELTDTPTLVAAGNLHTKVEPITFEGEEGEHYPMGEKVKRSIPHVPSCRIKYLSGTFHNHGTKNFAELTSGAAPKQARFYRDEAGLYIFELPEAHAAVVPNPNEVL